MPPFCPPLTVYIYGQEDWTFLDNKIIQFVGDAGTSNPPSGNGCAELDYYWANCGNIDYGFCFRTVHNWSAQACTYDAGDTCLVVQVQCCSFLNAACNSCTGYCCPDCDACKSFWRASDFVEDGTSGRGCWKLSLISDCTDEDCDDGTGMCSTDLHWWD